MANSKRKRKDQLSAVAVYIITMLTSIIILGVAAYFLMSQFIFPNLIPKQAEAKVATNQFIPEKTSGETILFGLKDDDNLKLLMLVKIIPEKKEVLCVPVPVSTVSKVNARHTTLKKHYGDSDTSALCTAVENAYDINVDRYMILDKDTFNYIVEKAGGVSFPVPCNMYYENETNGEVTDFKVKSSENIIYGDDLRKIITYPIHPDGEAFNVKTSDSAIVTLINQSLSSKDRILKEMDTIVDTLINSCSTNITDYDYQVEKKALTWFIENAEKPATYSIPKGEWNDDDEFVLSSEYKDELKEYFYIKSSE